MQNAELYRRAVVLPLDQDAEAALRSNDVAETTNVRILKIADTGEFEALWQIGLFREINARCATLLDEYEEEMIDAVLTDRIIDSIDMIICKEVAKHPEIIEFLNDLRNLARQASHSSRPLLFVL